MGDILGSLIFSVLTYLNHYQTVPVCTISQGELLVTYVMAFLLAALFMHMALNQKGRMYFNLQICLLLMKLSICQTFIRYVAINSHDALFIIVCYCCTQVLVDFARVMSWARFTWIVYLVTPGYVFYYRIYFTDSLEKVYLGNLVGLILCMGMKVFDPLPDMVYLYYAKK